jgi:prepilin-type N-terminal cleavage/methylation domain-containing protein
MKASSKGFTLIELLIVVVVIGILATIAIPKFSQMRTKAYIAAVTSDLKNTASVQEIYLSTEYIYASDVSDLDGMGCDRHAQRPGRSAVRDLLRRRHGQQCQSGNHSGSGAVQLTALYTAPQDRTGS